jgi:hypothetical protein
MVPVDAKVGWQSTADNTAQTLQAMVFKARSSFG